MRRLAALALLALGLAAAAWASGAGADDTRSYRVEMLNAFGIYEGSDVRIAGVRTGVVTGVEVNASKRAVVEVELSGPLATLGERTTCSTEPQSLIAEYFIDCQPRGEPLAEGATIPASRVTQSIQTDLLLNTLREPIRERARIVINELGTAMAANGENLNGGLRLAVPALTELRGVTKILAGQRRRIERLNVGAERVVRRLAERRGDVVAAISEARDTAEVAAARRGDLGRDVDLLDDFNAQLRPTLAALGDAARAGTPLLADLRRAAPALDELARRLPPFGESAGDAVVALGEASVPGTRALEEGRDEIRALRQAGRKAPATAEILADFLSDLDDPRRIVEEDERSLRTCDDPTQPCWATGRTDRLGHTGLESLLNYVYYQTGAINQFDSLGHFLHFNAFDAGAGPCGGFNAQPDVPARGGGRTTDIREADPCVSWVGKNQPDVNLDLGLPRYDDSVCRDGSTHPELCDPDVSNVPAGRDGSGRSSGSDGALPGIEGPGATVPGAPAPGVPGLAPETQRQLEDLLGIGEQAVPDLDAPVPLPGRGKGGGGKGKGGGGKGGGTSQAAQELLDFLYGG